jgi:hypothetical protein
MSKQNSLDEYFVKGKESNENNTLTKKCRVENKNIIFQSNKQRTRDQQVIVNLLATTQLQVRHSSIIFNPSIKILH